MTKLFTRMVSVLAFAGTMTAAISAEQGHFEGRVVVEPMEEGFVPSLRTVEDFGFRQAQGKLWKVERGQVFDGRGIPPMFRDRIGPPYESGLRKSLLVYESATQSMTEKWNEAQRMFFEASLAEGAKPDEAKVMYLLLAIQGSRWEKAREPSFCFGACHSPIIPLEWRPVIDEARSADLVQWVRSSDPHLDEIDSQAQTAIRAHGPHIFRQPACQRFSGSTLIRKTCD